MKQVLREDIRLHLPRLRQCDEQLISVQGRFGGGGSGGGGGGGGGDPDLQISWSKPAAKADGKWWQELPVLPKIAPGSPAAQVVLQSVATVCEILETVREINMDVVMRMETPEAYLKELPTDATAVVGKVCLLMFADALTLIYAVVLSSERESSVCLSLSVYLSFMPVDTTVIMGQVHTHTLTHTHSHSHSHSHSHTLSLTLSLSLSLSLSHTHTHTRRRRRFSRQKTQTSVSTFSPVFKCRMPCRRTPCWQKFSQVRPRVI
jgi:hypothetical protein